MSIVAAPDLTIEEILSSPPVPDEDKRIHIFGLEADTAMCGYRPEEPEHHCWNPARGWPTAVDVKANGGLCPGCNAPLCSTCEAEWGRYFYRRSDHL